MLGAVLAGGSSSRMGQDKASLTIGDETFLERAVRVVGSVTDAVVVCGDIEADGHEVVHDAKPGVGPLAGVVSALHRAEGGPVLVLAVDIPTVTTETLERLIARHVRTDQAVTTRSNGRVQPLCAVYGGDLATIAHDRLASDDRSMRTFLRTVPVWSMLDVSDTDIWNVNTPDDYRRLTTSP